MGFLKSLRGNPPDNIGGSSEENSAMNKQQRGNGSGPSYTAPPGSPPPPIKEEYLPPIGPPPSYDAGVGSSLPIPSSSNGPRTQDGLAPYHDWTSIPDTALLPPPPSIAYEASPTSNAELDEAIRAHRWCEQHPLLAPHVPTSFHISDVKAGKIDLVKPREFTGNLSKSRTGLWRGSRRAQNRDCCFLTSLPLYFALTDSPFRTQSTKTIYFEIKVVSFGRDIGGNACSLALGFCAVPYPTWRMPGWERGSLAVHSDDGRRYTNDTNGGKDFIEPILAGQTVGIGITYSIPDATPDFQPSPADGPPLQAKVIFTRSGTIENEWDLHEELDAENDEFGSLGVDGKYDLYGAIGMFGEVAFEANFSDSDWLWRPS